MPRRKQSQFVNSSLPLDWGGDASASSGKKSSQGGSDGHHTFTVTQVTQYLKEVFSGDPVLGHPIVVQGELSNIKRSSRGHVYFNLRDEHASLSGILWASTVIRLPFELEEGLEVFATGTMDIYAPTGSYSLIVRKMEPVGKGALQLAFEQLKAKLEAEGLFDPRHKKALPPFPRRIGIVTAPTGAVIHDMIRTIRQKNTLVDILLHPVPVQGDGAAPAIAHAIDTLNDPAYNLDLMIIGRGGGSLEDLFCFSEEPVVRAVFRSQLPIIAGVGHEPDFSLADAAADYSAATPTMAADAAVPDVNALLDTFTQWREDLAQGLEHTMWRFEQQLDHQSTRFLDRAQQFFRDYESLLTQQEKDLTDLITGRLDQAQDRVASRAEQLDAFSPLSILSRGYAVTTLAKDGQKPTVVRSIQDVQPQDTLRIRVTDGEIHTTVTDTTPIDIPITPSSPTPPSD